MIVFIQACGLDANDHGGSPKIFRSLLATEHPPVLSINTYFSTTPGSFIGNELQLPLRPGFAHLEFTRMHRALTLLDGLYRRQFEKKLRRALTEHRVKLIHLLANTYSIVPVHNIVSQLGIPYVLSIHDDLDYVSSGHLLMKQMTAHMGRAWREAKAVFVISEEIGHEYSRRYGLREYRIVTDGLKCVADAPRQRPERSLRLYFMGLFHNTYAPNLRAVLDALKMVRSRHPDWEITVTCRCSAISAPVRADDVPVRVLPFAPEAEVERDLLSADLLYQPLPFQESARALGRFSMSTKMITYLGSGLPIFYHGPEDAAACKLLARHEAAAICTTLDPEEIAKCLLDAAARREIVVHRALSLARSQFLLADQQRRFWEPILQAL